MNISITFPDGAVREFPSGISAIDIAKSISSKLAKSTLAVELDGTLKDLRTEISGDAHIKFLTFDDEGGKKAFWHTTSHVMAQAVKRLLPDARVAIGPAIENGFYYDFDCETPFTPELLEKIEAEMSRIIKENPPIIRYELSRADSLKKAADANEQYKVELCEAIAEDMPISFYEQGEFWDLCAGPHIADISAIKAFKLTSIAGAYWRGDEHNKMLQRIYGISFPKKEQLDEYLHMMEEARARDHRKLGRELDLFSVMEEGPGFPFFHPKGMILRNELESFWRAEHRRRGYEEIRTPLILDSELWKRSGHWDHYKDNMYFTTIDERNFAIKPMNCPGGLLLYNRKLHSYKELPIRCGELGIVHRHELSGALHGLMRVRCFTQDDAHIFMTEEQIRSEILGVIKLEDYFYSLFGFSYFVELSTMPEDHIGSIEDWERATNELIAALNDAGLPFVVNEGDGAFYGPKIDFHLKDAIGRTWQCGTIQLDFQMPERFDATYIGADGAKHRPIMIHRTIFGSIERFIGILTEHFAGAFPLWLSPVQVSILPVNEAYNDYAEQVRDKLEELGIRTEVDGRNEKLGLKIREAQLQKVPYMFVIGSKEQEAGGVGIRTRSGEDLGLVSFEDAAAKLTEEIKNKTYTLK